MEERKELGKYRIASDEVVNDLTRQQEESLNRLLDVINNPFKDEWEFMKWHRKVIILQLSQIDSNDFFLNNKALWGHLLATEDNLFYREITIKLIHNFLESSYAKSRMELATRESGNPFNEKIE